MKIKRITAEKFRPYGRIIYYPNKMRKKKVRNLWRIVLADPSAAGWRIAYLVLRDRRIRRLERHPATFESFEPVRGKSLIYVTRRKDPKSIQCFYLDQPIILNKNIWHGLVTLTPECEIKITENASVKCAYWPLRTFLSVKEQRHGKL